MNYDHASISNSTVVMCQARTPMLSLGQAESPDKAEGVCDGTAD